MDERNIFAVLGIAETKDEAQIRAAYREKLVTVNPEDNPEGFKQLREAYEEALAYARRPEGDGAEEEANDPVSLFLKKVDEVYRVLPRRLDEEEWEALVKEDLLDDLELGEEAQWRMFSYLADHYRLPAKIWRILDRVFGIVENQQEFKEHLNQNFVEFMVWKASEDADNTDFTFERLEGEPEADYDNFLNHYDELIRLLNQEGEAEDRQNWVKSLSQKVAFLDGMGISHPWYAMERAKVLYFLGQEEEAEQIARSLLAENKEDRRIFLAEARMLDRRGLIEEAEKNYREFLEFEGLTDDQIYTAAIRLAELNAQKEDWEEARKYALRGRRIYNTQNANEQLDKANAELIRIYTGEKSDALTVEEGTRLAWCYIQTGRAKEGHRFFEEHPVLEANTAECRWAKVVMALENEQGERARQEAQEWRRILLAQMEDALQKQDNPREEAAGDEDAPDEEELKYRIAQSFELEGKACQILYGQQKDKESEEAAGYREAGLKAFDEAIARQEEDVEFLLAKVLFFRDLKEYEQAAALCERMKGINDQYYWAYFYAQEAYEELRKAQEVVDNFYDAKRIFAGHAEIYERALRVFLDYNQLKDAQHIVDQADEAGVSSPYLMVKKLGLMRRLIEEEEKQKEIDEYAQKVIEELEEKGGQDKLLAEAYMQRAYLHDDNSRQDFFAEADMEKWTKRAIELADTMNARYFLGRYYVEYKDDAKKAYEQLKICEERGMEFPWMYYYIARCMEEFSRWDDAIAYYKKGFEKAPKERDFAWRIAWLYRRKFVRTGQPEYMQEAFRYLDIQKEIAGMNATGYWQYSDLHARMRDYEKALEEIDEALKKNGQSRNWGHKGMLLELLGRPDEAVECYEKGIEAGLKDGEDYDYSYSQMYDYFLDKKDYKGGIEWLKQALAKVLTEETRDDIKKKIRDLYKQMKGWNRALGMVEQRYGSVDLAEYKYETWDEEGRRIQDALEIYERYLSEEELLEKNRQVERLLEGEGSQKLKDHAYGKWHAYIALGYSYEDYLLDDKSALIWLEKAQEQIEKLGEDADDDDLSDTYYNLMECHYRLGNLKQARHYGELYKKAILKKYGECSALGMKPEELHERAVGCRRRNLHHLFLQSYYCNEHEKARRIVEEMEKSDLCWWCNRKDCMELWECKGFMALADGDKQEAYRCFQRSIECAPGGNVTGEREIRRLKKEGITED